MEKNDILTEKDQNLLMSYVDGQCSWWRKRKAQSILERSTSAQEFVQELSGLNIGLNDLAKQVTANTKKVDLWTRIENRIDQEEHAAFFLGERKLSQNIKTEKSSWWNSWTIAAPAGALAALLVIVSTGHFNDRSGLAANFSKQVAFYTEPANTSMAGSNTIVPITSSVSSNAVTNNLELEWLRSHGRVQMIQHDQGQTPVIWISRAEAIRQWEAANRLRNRVSVPTRNSNGIKIIEKNVPNVYTVAD